MVDSQLEGEGAPEVGLEGMGVGLQEGPTKPAQLTQTTSSSTFIKENMDVLRTMIKEHGLQPKAKMTPRKLVYEEFKEENFGISRTKDLSERLSKESSDTISERLESQSKSKAKPRGEKARSRGKRSGRGEVSADSEGEGGSKDQEDHQGIFSAAAEQEEWPMPVWCMMFCQTLSGAARN
nr:putative reverse transcriptase domain-containing protein [Tanacetum cinerariifolium]